MKWKSYYGISASVIFAEWVIVHRDCGCHLLIKHNSIHEQINRFCVISKSFVILCPTNCDSYHSFDLIVSSHCVWCCECFSVREEVMKNIYLRSTRKIIETPWRQNRLFVRTATEKSNLRITELYEGSSANNGKYPSQSPSLYLPWCYQEYPELDRNNIRMKWSAGKLQQNDKFGAI